MWFLILNSTIATAFAAVAAPPPALPTCTLAASPASIQAGSTATLTFNATNATGGKIDPLGWAVGTSGTKVVSPSLTTLYTATFTGTEGATTTCSATITVVGPRTKPIISSFTATPARLAPGQSALLSWTVTGATSLSLTNLGTVGGTSRTVSPAATTTYLLTATNNAGSITAAKTVTVSPDGPPPTCTLAANPATLQAGSSTTLTFASTNATAGMINNSGGAVGTSGTKVVAPSVSTLYTATFTGTGGTVSCAANVTVTAAPSANLIQNGNLETADPAGPAFPLNWASNAWNATTTFTYPVAGMGGGKAAKLVTTAVSAGGGATWAFRHIPVSSQTMYQYSNDYMSNVVSNVTVEYLHSNGTYTREWVNQPAQTGTTWGHQVINITVPTDVVSFTVIHGLGTVGTLTIDNVALVALPASPFANGMVSLTYDDGLTSQYNNAVPLLKAAGLTATFAIITNAPASGDAASMTWANIKDLSASGFEIAAHTQTHASLTELTSTKVQQEIQGAYKDFVAHGLLPTTLVYPFGDVNPAVQQIVKNVGLIGARASYFGMNAPLSDRYALQDIRVDATTTLALVKQNIDQAIRNKRWLILELHDVLASGGDDLSITPTMMQDIINYIKTSGIRTVTLDQGLRQMAP